MTSFASRVIRLLCGTAAAACLQPALAQIGTVQFAAGDVSIIGPAGTRVAVRGITFRESESIVTGVNSSAQLRMIDQGFIAVRPETVMKFDQYRYSGREDGAERGVLSLVKGGFRTITGVIGRINRNNYTVTTPTATIGIRGTDHEVVHVVAAPAGPQGPVGNIAPVQVASAELVRTDFGLIDLAQAAAVPVPSAGPGIPVGSYNRVNVGATVMRTDVAVLNLGRNQVGFAPSRSEAPRFAPPNVVNQLFTTTARPGQPQRPSGQQGQQQDQQQQGQQQGAQSGQPAAPAQTTGAAEPAPAAEPIRSVAVVDNPSQIAAGVSNAASGAPLAQTTAFTAAIASTPIPGGSGSSSSYASSGSAVSSVTSTSVPIILTGASGATVNATTQTATTSSGSTAPITQAPDAQFSNPAVAAPPDGFGFAILGSKAAGTGQELVVVDNKTSQAGSNYVLDGSNNLVQVLSAEKIEAAGSNYTDSSTDTSASPFPSRFVKFAGGSAQDAFKASDNSLYLGRWQGGTMDIFSDTGISGGNSLLESISLGPRSAHWLVFENPQQNLMQKLVGTNTYSLLASTKPTDSFGNAGTLNSASISADFSSLTASANLNLSFSGARTLQLNARTPSVPIQSNGFRSQSGTPYAPTISCTGIDCNVVSLAATTNGNWLGGIRGGFGGANAAGAALAYAFAPALVSPAANTANVDLIEGVAALSSTVPALGVNPTAVGSTGQYRTSVLYSVDGSNGTKFLATNNVGGSTTPTSLPNTAFVLDANGNLVHVLGAAWNAFNAGAATQCLGNAPCLSNPPYTGATPSPSTTSIFSMGGGVLGTGGFTFNANGDKSGNGASEFYNDTTNGLRFGRYQGGTVHAATSTGNFSDLLTNLGSNSALWMIREIPAAIPVTGTFHYLPTFATAPADNFGNVGTLNYATLDANFSNQTVNATVSLDIAAASLRGRAQQVPIGATGKGFDVSSSASANATFNPAPPIPISSTCLGTCPALPFGATGGPAYGARFTGAFSGDGTAAGAQMRYTFNTYYDASLTPGSAVAGAAPAGVVPNQYINGMVGFTKGAGLTVPANLGKAVATSFFYYAAPLNFGSNDFMSNQSDGGPTLTSAFLGPNGNLSSMSDASSAGTESLTIGGVTTGASTVTTLANGINFGRYDATHAAGPAGPALTISGKNFNGTFSNTPVLGSLQWIAGPNLWPIFSANVIPGTATYTTSAANASLPTDQNGATGTFNSASLTVNFDKQSVDTSLSVTMPANTLAGGTNTREWAATASNVRLDGGGGFSAGGNSGTYAHNSLAVKLNTVGYTGAARGNLNGQLTGPLVNGAIISYTFGGSDPSNSNKHEHVNGVIGFGSPVFSLATADVLSPYRIRLAARGTAGGFDATSGALASVSAASINDEFLTRTIISAEDWSRLKFNSSGELTDFDARGVFVSGASAGSCVASCSTTQSPVRVSINPSATAAGSTVNGGVIPAMPAIASGAATIVQSGADATTGILWGRYSNGNFAMVDRVTGSPVGTGNTTLGPINHYLLSPVQSGPTVLPTSGSFTYAFVGGTSPTDSLGNVGAVPTAANPAATLSANFLANTVSATVNAVVGPRTWTASANNMKILAGTGFEAQRKLNGTGTLSVGCTGTSCNAAQLAGSIVGAFTGTTGQGAGLAYSLNTGGVSGITMGGVAAFKRTP